jgi:hypothetical protein
MKIDIEARKTEYGWQRTIDNFWLKGTPKWFEWLEWVIILGVFTFLDKNYEIPVISIIVVISYLAFLFYFNSFFFSIEFHGVPYVKSNRKRRLVSLILSAILTIGVLSLLTRTVSAISGKI